MDKSPKMSEADHQVMKLAWSSFRRRSKMKLCRLLGLSFLVCFVFPVWAYGDRLEEAKAAVQNENFEKAFELLRPLAEENNAEAQFLLGSLYINGQGVEKDDTKGITWVMKAAGQGYAEARSHAINICLDLANQGDTTAMYNLGYMCLQEWGGERDPNVCTEWLERAAESGHERSAKVLSGIYAKGKFGISPDEEKASYWRHLPAAFAAVTDGTWSGESPDQGGLPADFTYDSDAEEWILEDTIVTGQRLLSSLKMEGIRAEEIKFEIFNSLNSNDEFDITCKWYSPLGTRVKKWGCDAGFNVDARTGDGRDLLYNYLLQGRGRPIIPQVFPDKIRALNKEMVELAVRHPSLRKAMINEYELKQRYVVERREKYKDGISIERPEKYFENELKFLDVAYVAYNDGMMEEEIWRYWDGRFRSMIHQEPYRSVWLSSNTETYADEFVAYVNTIISGE
jgi:TPR repeat protein